MLMHMHAHTWIQDSTMGYMFNCHASSDSFFVFLIDLHCYVASESEQSDSYRYKNILFKILSHYGLLQDIIVPNTI